jgi:hypothetical protein
MTMNSTTAAAITSVKDVAIPATALSTKNYFNNSSNNGIKSS